MACSSLLDAARIGFGRLEKCKLTDANKVRGGDDERKKQDNDRARRF